ncbi:hypothetical protein K1W54_04625 [Micromonospora sp. CPCC 205371]|nr:hypothetical protein [Micromonospora sp. CPCC 205371]
MPRFHVDPPSHVASPFGLLSVVDARYDEPSPHWRQGVEWDALCGTISTTYDPCFSVTGTGDPPPPPPPKTSELTFEDRGATPFTVVADFECSPAAWAGEAARLGEEALTRLESYQVERAFWTGVAAGQEVVFPHLAADAEVTDGGAHPVLLQTAATPVTGSVMNVVEGLGLLEQALADCYNGVGVIHVPASLGPLLAAERLVERDGRRLRTIKGNLVALGAGYPGTGPDGSPPAAGGVWMYATGPVLAYRSRVEVPPQPSTINRSNNTVQAIAERTYVLGWDCCHLAVQVGANPFLGDDSGALQAAEFSAEAPLVWDAGTETVSLEPGADGQYLATDGSTVEWETAGQPGALAGPLDGSGHIPASQLPPQPLHETFEANSEAAMLAAPVSAPSVAIRTDFSPPHLFYLHTDPASDINNWEDLGAGISAGADPTAEVGTVPINGIAATYMRSDAAPAINEAMVPTWSGKHTFGGGVQIPTGAAVGRLLVSDATGNAAWEDPAAAPVLSVNGKTGVVHLVPLDVGSVPVTGGTVTGPLLVDQNVQGMKLRLAMKLPGTQQDAPTSFGVTATYLGIGGGEWASGSYRLIGFGYIGAAGNQYPAVIGYEETSTSSNTRGDLVFGVRPNNNNVAPTIALRVRSDGQILAEAGAAYTPTTDGSLTTRKYVTDLIDALPAPTGGGGLEAPAFHTGATDITLFPNDVAVHLVDTSAAGSTVVVNLPDALDSTAPGKTFTIKKIAGSQGISIDGGEGNLDGQASIGMSDQWSFRTVIFDGTNWQIIGSGGS